MKISVITVTYNRKGDLRRALRSIRRQAGVEFEAIVVDNGSSDGTVEMLHEEFPWVRVIEMGANTGMRAHNRAIREAVAPYVFILDNDMVLVEDDVLASVCDFLSRDLKLGAAACRVWDVVRTENGPALKISGNSPKHIQTDDPSGGYETSAFDGGGAAFRKSALVETGLFCEEFFLYHGEVDLTTRLLDFGWNVRYFPKISVIHCHSAVQRSSSFNSYLITRNYFWYLYRNYPARELIRESMRYLRGSAWQALRGRRRFFFWLKGVAIGIFRRSPGRKPVSIEIIRRQQAIRDADRLRKASTGEMGVVHPLSSAEIEKYGLSQPSTNTALR